MSFTGKTAVTGTTAVTGKTALVTGGSRGIGRAIVRRLAGDGASVVFSYRANQKLAEELVAELPGTLAVQADQEDLASIEDLFEPLRDGLDIVVNNAAVATQAPLAEITPEEFDRVLAINTTYPLMVIRRAAPLLRDGGRIINISTLNTAIAAPGLALYQASKAALEQLTKVFARELGERGITVNTVSAGATDTDMFAAANPPEARAQSAAVTALRRLGQPADIANVVAMLAGPDAQWITGQNIYATGGLIL